MKPRPPKPHGFTLVEVLVALAVLAIALAATLRAMGQAIDLTTDLRARTLALWVAEERAAELRLTRAWPGLDTKDDTMEFGGQEWRLQERISSTPHPDVRRIDIDVRAVRSPDILARLSVFVSKP
jgi:general secretion pathway protein I